MAYRFAPENLKFLREKRGLSVRELAEEIGVAYQTVWAWETGYGHGPQLVTFLHACSALQVSPMEFIEEEHV